MAGSEVLRRSVGLHVGDAVSDAVVRLAAGKRYVLLGEASHGTSEFYRERAALTRRLIEEAGFTAVAVEADWPDAYRVNRYVRGDDAAGSVEDALGAFERFPLWMWRNREVAAFVGWLRAHNRRSPGHGFYGLDLYSLPRSIDAVVRYLEDVDPAAAERARSRYACFDHFDHDSQAYAYATATGRADPCEEGVVEQLQELQRRAGELVAQDGASAEDSQFFAEQNARLVLNAERYYRSMFWGRAESWNLRDTHMADTLDALVGHLGRNGGEPKVVVWAHNSHLGDARATELGAMGELNVGQLVRERHGDEALLVGFTTYTGTVMAATDWGGPHEVKQVRRAVDGSYEALLHEVGEQRFLLDLHEPDVADALADDRLERAIGVIYRPRTERQSHYFRAELARQFDAVIHIDETTAVTPLDRASKREEDAVPDTFPTGV